VRFSLVAGGGVLHRRQGREEGRKTFQIPLFAWTFTAAAIGFTRRKWRPRMEKNAPPLFPPSKGLSALLLSPRSCTDVPTPQHCSEYFFGVYFVNLKLFNVMFVLF